MEETCEVILSNFLYCNLEISPPGDINPQFPLLLSYHVYLVLNAETPVAKRNRFEHRNLSNWVEYFRSLNSEPIDLHGGCEDHKNQPKVLQGKTNLPEKHCGVLATRLHVQTWNAACCAKACLPRKPQAASREEHGMSVYMAWETKSVDTKFRDPLSKTICNFPLSLFSGGGRGRFHQKKKTNQKHCGLFCFCRFLSEWLGEMAFLASGSPPVKGESLFAKVLQDLQRDDSRPLFTYLYIF